MLSGAESLQSCEAWFLCGTPAKASFHSLDLRVEFGVEKSGFVYASVSVHKDS